MAKSNSRKSRMQNKTKQEAQAYRMFLAHSPYGPASTNGLVNESLQGSDELYNTDGSYLKQPQKPVPTPKRIKIFTWVKENTGELLIGVILVGVLTWLCSSVVNLQITSATQTERLSYIKDEIDELSDNSVTKDVLNLEIESVKKDLDNLNVFTMDALKERMDNLEKQVELSKKEESNK